MSTPSEIARLHWGAEMPRWIEDLARECEASSQNKVAQRLGRSAALISQVLRAKYPGDLAAVEELFNGAFNAATVDCPALGQLPANECRHWREKARRFVNVNSLRVRMYRACSSCPRNRREGADA
jgi:transcriptional regulator with XRE-family HTH domain